MKDKIAEWKNQYGRVFKIRLEGNDVYYRNMVASEMITDNGVEGTEELAKNVILYSERPLKLAGSFAKIADHVLQGSAVESLDDLKLKAIENRDKIQNNLILNLISQICAVYPYTPDQLMNKTFDQLFDIISMIEVSTGREIIQTTEGNRGHKVPTPPDFREGEKFNKPDENILMEESVDALANEMAKHGKKAPTLNEVKNSHLSDLHKQMKQLENV